MAVHSYKISGRIFIILGLLIPFLLPAQKRETVNAVKYTSANGLTGYNIRKIVQDKYGYTWLAMQDGLYRFNGSSFSFYQRSSTEKSRLLGIDIRDLALDTINNLLWVLSGEGGLNAISCITGRIVKSIPITSNNAENWNICMTISENRLWIGSFNDIKIFNIKQNRFESSPRLPALAIERNTYAIRNIHPDIYGNVWIGITGYGLVIMAAKSKRILKEIPLPQVKGQAAIRVLTALHKAPGIALLGTSQGLRQISYDRHYNYRLNIRPARAATEVNHTLITAITLLDHQLLVSSDQHLYRFTPDLFSCVVLEEPQKKNENSWLSNVVCMSTDSLHNVWLGCSQGLAFIRNKPSPFLSIYQDYKAGYKLNHVYGMLPLPDSTLLIGHEGGLGLYKMGDHTFQQINDIPCYYIYETPDHEVYVSNKKGIFIYRPHHLISIAKIYPEFKPYASWPLISCLPLSDTAVVLGTDNFKGILIWNPLHHTIKQVSISTSPVHLAADIVNSLYKDSKNQVWILSDKAITLFSKNFRETRFLIYKDLVTHQPHNIYFDICEANGSYWIAAYGMGIIQLDSSYKVRRIFSTKEGLCNNGVYKIFSYRDSLLIITTNNGLSVFNPRAYTFRNYFDADGLHGNAFEEACGVYKEGKIYAGGINGLTIVDPTLFTFNARPPALYVDNIHLELQSGIVDTSNLQLTTLKVPQDVLQTTVSFSALNCTAPGNVRLAYKIVELHQQWTDLGAQRSVNLIGLHPGTYTLEVKAANEDGIWSKKPLRLVLNYLPKWYQTGWFKALIIIGVAGLLYALYYYRISQLKQQQQIRKSIASDLHDDIGSTLNTIKVFAHLAQRSPEDNGYLQQIAQLLTQATAGLRDMIWVLDEPGDTVYMLTERIKQFILPVANAKQIHFECTISDNMRNIPLSKTAKRNLLLIAKESLNNSIKYAYCKNIRLEVKSIHNKPALLIMDDGCGFNTNHLPTGNGLKNIRYRAKQIHYEAVITSSPGKGTSILICPSI